MNKYELTLKVDGANFNFGAYNTFEKALSVLAGTLYKANSVIFDLVKDSKIKSFTCDIWEYMANADDDYGMPYYEVKPFYYEMDMNTIISQSVIYTCSPVEWITESYWFFEDLYSIEVYYINFDDTHYEKYQIKRVE